MISLPSRYLVTTPTGISPLLFLLRNFPPLFIVRLSLHGVTSHGIRGTGSIVDIHFSFFLFSSQQTKSNRFIFASFKTRWKDSLNPFSSKKFLYLRKERKRENEDTNDISCKSRRSAGEHKNILLRTISKRSPWPWFSRITIHLPLFGWRISMASA